MKKHAAGEIKIIALVLVELSQLRVENAGGSRSGKSYKNILC